MQRIPELEAPSGHENRPRAPTRGAVRAQGDRVRLKRTGEEGRIVHVFATYPFRGDVVVQLGERRELCSEDEIQKA